MIAGANLSSLKKRNIEDKKSFAEIQVIFSPTSLKPIFHQVFLGRDWAFEIFVSMITISKSNCIFMKQNPKCSLC